MNYPIITAVLLYSFLLTGCNADQAMHKAHSYLPPQLKFLEEKQEAPVNSKVETIPAPAAAPAPSSKGVDGYDLAQTPAPVTVSNDSVTLRGKVDTSDDLFYSMPAEPTPAAPVAPQLAPPAIFGQSFQASTQEPAAPR